MAEGMEMVVVVVLWDGDIEGREESKSISSSDNNYLNHTWSNNYPKHLKILLY